MKKTIDILEYILDCLSEKDSDCYVSELDIYNIFNKKIPLRKIQDRLKELHGGRDLGKASETFANLIRLQLPEEDNDGEYAWTADIELLRRERFNLKEQQKRLPELIRQTRDMEDVQRERRSEADKLIDRIRLLRVLHTKLTRCGADNFVPEDELAAAYYGADNADNRIRIKRELASLHGRKSHELNETSYFCNLRRVQYGRRFGWTADLVKLRNLLGLRSSEDPVDTLARSIVSFLGGKNITFSSEVMSNSDVVDLISKDFLHLIEVAIERNKKTGSVKTESPAVLE